jgi:hypothetical protein
MTSWSNHLLSESTLPGNFEHKAKYSKKIHVRSMPMWQMNGRLSCFNKLAPLALFMVTLIGLHFTASGKILLSNATF